MKKVTIIVPVYNAEPYISRCLDSLVNQTYKNIEIIVIDDCSTDNSVNIVEEYKKKYNNIVFIKNNEKKKTFEIRRIGMETADGDYIGFCDADDYHELNSFEYMVNRIQEKDYDLISVCTVNNENNWKMPFIKEHEYLNGELYSSFMKYKDKYGLWSLLIKKSIIDKALKYMNYFVYLAHAEDRLWSNIIFYYVQKSLHTSEPLYNYCKNIESISMSNHYLETHINRLKEYSIMLEEIKKFLLYHNIYDTYKNEYMKTCEIHANIAFIQLKRHQEFSYELLFNNINDDLRNGLINYLYNDVNKYKNDVNKYKNDVNKYKIIINRTNIADILFSISWNNNYVIFMIVGFKIKIRKDDFIKKISWWIPIKKWRDNFRSSFQ